MNIHKIIDTAGWVALVVFLGVLVAAFIKTGDVILLILGLFFFGTGISVKQANADLTKKIQESKKLIERIQQ